MQTSSHLVEIATSALCARTKDAPLRYAADIISFYRFLRVDDLKSRRATRVKALCFEVGDAAVLYHTSNGIDPDEAIDALIAILHHCRQLRHLRMIQWYYQVPPSHIYRAISSFEHLDELQLNIMDDILEEDVLRLANLPLRRLTCLSIRRALLNPENYMALGRGRLATTLVELQLPVQPQICKMLGATFSSVRKLGLSAPKHSTFVNDLQLIFPNISHLTLLGHCPWDDPRRTWADGNAEDRNEAIRQTHQQQWNDTPSMWPDLKYVHVADPRAAYLLGLKKSVPWISINWMCYTPAHIFPMILEDTRPTALEFVLDDSNYYGSLQIPQGPFDGLRQLTDRPGVVSSVRYLVVHFRRFTVPSVDRQLHEAIVRITSVSR